jgi:uncharacterized protein YprB with RNaseH-like and TPR domain
VRFSPWLRERLSALRKGPSSVDVAEETRLVAPELAVAIRASQTSWADHPALDGPPELVTVETPAGPIEVRRVVLPIPPDALQRAVGESASDRPLFFDTETMGLGPQMIFLAGFAWPVDGQLQIEQIFARDYAREGALLHRLGERWRQADRIVTFNGRAYDIPLARDRATRYRLSTWYPVPDVDLLPLARRAWRGRFRDFRLTSLEFHVLGRARQGDIPGREIPQLYRRSVETGDARPLAPVFRHNALDLLAMVELHDRALGVVPDGGRDRP